MPGHLVMEGDKVSLYTVTKDDLKVIWEYLEDEDARFELFDPTLIIYPEDLEEFYNKLTESDKYIWLLVVRNEDQKILGLVEIVVKNKLNRNGELSYFIKKEFRNKGYATESVKLALKYAFEILNLDKLHAEVDETNIASRKVLEKSRFKLVGRLRKHSWVPGRGKVDLLFYDILREEYCKDR